MAEYDLVIFDCDGVVIDSELISAEMLISTLAEYGVEIDLAYVARHFLGRSYPVVLKQIREEFGITLRDDFEAHYRATLLAAFDRDLVEMPAVREVLTELNVPYCLATSSSPPRVSQSLAITGLDTAFTSRVFTASEVKNGKPAPDLFLHAARVMGVAPSRCLVVEDSRTGVRAGLAAGMTVVRFVGGGHLVNGFDLPLGDTNPHFQLEHFGSFFALFPQLKVKKAEVRS